MTAGRSRVARVLTRVRRGLATRPSDRVDAVANADEKVLVRELVRRSKGGGAGLETLLRRLSDEQLVGELARRDNRGDERESLLVERLSPQQQARMLATPGDEVLAQELFRRSERTDLAASIGPRLLGELVSRFRPRQRLEYDRCEIELAVSSGFSYKRLRAAQKEPFTVEWLERSIRPGAVLFDIGANVGAYSLIAAKLADGDVTVYAFEPAAPSFADLSRNIALNGCERSVIPLPLALWDRTGAVTFGYRSLEPGDAGHAVSDDRGSASASESSQRALAFRLDDLVAWFELPTPTLVKLDVDGPELKVLEGATATMSDARCRELMIEIDGLPDERNAVAITELLARCGFELAQRHDRGQGAYCLFAKG